MKWPLFQNYFTRLAAFGFLGFLLASQMGCSVQGQITDLTKKTSVPALSQAMGIVSGSAQNMVVNSYNVSVTVGDYAGGQIEQTVNSYTVYTSVQGSLSSEANQIMSH